MLMVAGALGVAFIPYSIFAVHPTMDKLKMMDRKHQLQGKEDVSIEAIRAFELMSQWEILQAIRTGLFGIIWGLCLWALVIHDFQV